MKSYRVTLSGWTASFRHPQLVTGAQPTLPLPPPSTVYGLISAAAGRWIDPKECRMGYVFTSEGGARDLEKIYQFQKSSSASSTVIYRDWLTDWTLSVYFTERQWADNFLSPVYPLTLGRQQELAHVELGESGKTISSLELQNESAVLYGTVVPFPFPNAFGLVMALPLTMTPDLPRQSVEVRPRLMVRDRVRVEHPEIWRDGERDHGVYFFGGSES